MIYYLKISSLVEVWLELWRKVSVSGGRWEESRFLDEEMLVSIVFEFGMNLLLGMVIKKDGKKSKWEEKKK